MRLIKWAGLVFTSAGVYKIVICTRGVVVVVVVVYGMGFPCRVIEWKSLE